MKQITFILDLDIQGSMEEVENFINEVSVPFTSQCDEPNTHSFEWYLNKQQGRAILHEKFEDSDAACLRVENLTSSHVNDSFQSLFNVVKFTVLGESNTALRKILENWQPHFLSYEAGFNKKI